MSDQAVEILITNAIHSAFIKYPEGDGGPNLDYEWIAPDQSTHIAKAILLELSANGYQVAKKHARGRCLIHPVSTCAFATAGGPCDRPRGLPSHDAGVA